MKFLSDYEEYLIYAKLSGSLSPDEEKLCEELLSANEYAREIYERLLKKLPEADVPNSFSRFKDAGKWKDIYHVSGSRSNVNRSTIVRKLSIAAAAAVLVIAAGTWFFWKNIDQPKLSAITNTSQKSVQLTLAGGQQIDLTHNRGNINSGEAQLTNSGSALHYATTTGASAALNHLVVPTGMDYQVKLSDGTTIWLNAATRLDFPFVFTGNTREVTIEGEAYLEVAKQPGKPFLVHLPNSTVQVLGTSFNVNSYDEGVEQVALVEGRVLMKAKDTALELTPGKAVTFKQGTGLEQSTFDARKVLAWRDGLFYFKNATVMEISRVIPRWYGMETKVDNKSIQSRRFTGVVDKKQPISIFQNNLKAISGIDSYIDTGNVLHFR